MAVGRVALLSLVVEGVTPSLLIVVGILASDITLNLSLTLVKKAQRQLWFHYSY